MTLDDQLRSFLQAVSTMVSTDPRRPVFGGAFEDFVFRNGRMFKRMTLSAEEINYLLCCQKRSRHRPAPKACYFNAMSVLVFGDLQLDRRLRYVEGYGLRLIPTMHAWLTFAGSEAVFDPTWTLAEPVYPGLPPWVFGSWNDERAYFGVEFSTDYVHQKVKAGSNGVSLLDDEDAGWPLLRGETGWRP